MVFPPGWDRIAINDWLGADNEMAVMTTYPNRAVDRNDQHHSPARCNTVWGHNVVACGTSAMNMQHKGAPSLVAFFGAGIAFNKCHANRVVPYDPYMAFLFKGEEYDRSARLWTHGYDLYAPRKNYAYHFYDDDPKPQNVRGASRPRDRSFLYGNHEVNELVLQSEIRWQAIFGMLRPPPAVSDADSDRVERLKNAFQKAKQLKEFTAQDVELFGLGTKRSLREYLVFSGINLIKHTNKDLCGLIGRMPWVPWDIPADFEPTGKNCRSPPDVVAASGGGLVGWLSSSGSSSSSSGAAAANKDGKNRACRCLTTLDQVRSRAAVYLNLTNHEVYERTKASRAVPSERISEPLLSRGWELAKSEC